jgi:hypothetical protein
MTFVWSKKIPLTVLISMFMVLTGILLALLSAAQNQLFGEIPLYLHFIIYQMFYFLRHILKVWLMNSEVNFFDASVQTD